MNEWGEHALYLKPGEVLLGARKTFYETSKVISGYMDCIMACSLKHATVTELAESATVPVING